MTKGLDFGSFIFKLENKGRNGTASLLDIKHSHSSLNPVTKNSWKKKTWVQIFKRFLSGNQKALYNLLGFWRFHHLEKIKELLELLNVEFWFLIGKRSRVNSTGNREMLARMVAEDFTKGIKAPGAPIQSNSITFESHLFPLIQ